MTETIYRLMAGEMFFNKDVKSVKHVIAVMPRNWVALHSKVNNGPRINKPHLSTSSITTTLPNTPRISLTMSYNPRMSMVPSSQQQNRGRKKEEESDAFMRLVCLSTS